MRQTDESDVHFKPLERPFWLEHDYEAVRNEIKIIKEQLKNNLARSEQKWGWDETTQESCCCCKGVVRCRNWRTGDSWHNYVQMVSLRTVVCYFALFTFAIFFIKSKPSAVQTRYSISSKAKVYINLNLLFVLDLLLKKRNWVLTSRSSLM